MKRPGMGFVLVVGALAIAGGLIAYTLRPPAPSYFSDEVRRGDVDAEVTLKGTLEYSGGIAVRALATRPDILKMTIGQPARFTLIGDQPRWHTAVLRSVETPPEELRPLPPGQIDPSLANQGDALPEVEDEAQLSPFAIAPPHEPAPPPKPEDPEVLYPAVFTVTSRDSSLTVGSGVELRVALGQVRGVPIIPASALGPRGSDGSYAVQVVLPNGRLAQRNIRVGLAGEQVVEVKDGLRLGERVVTGQGVSSGR